MGGSVPLGSVPWDKWDRDGHRGQFWGGQEGAGPTVIPTDLGQPPPKSPGGAGRACPRSAGGVQPSCPRGTNPGDNTTASVEPLNHRRVVSPFQTPAPCWWPPQPGEGTAVGTVGAPKSPNPTGKGGGGPAEPGSRVGARISRRALPSAQAGGRRVRGAPPWPRGKLSWFSSSQHGRLRRRHRNAAASWAERGPAGGNGRGSWRGVTGGDGGVGT